MTKAALLKYLKSSVHVNVPFILNVDQKERIFEQNEMVYCNVAVKIPC